MTVAPGAAHCSASAISVPATSHVDGPEDPELRELVRLVNLHRASLHLRPLAWSPRAAAVALAHSRDMERRDFFSHVNPDHASPFDRLDGAGIHYVRAGENIAYGYAAAAEVLQGWLDSPGHRRNLENPDYTEQGIAVSGTMWTHVFLTPDGAERVQNTTPVSAASTMRPTRARGRGAHGGSTTALASR